MSISPELVSLLTEPELIEDELCRRSLSHHIKRVFNTTEPVDYHHNWHVDYMAEHLTALHNREIKRLILNVPPGYTKSITGNVGFSSFIMGQDPKSRILGACHTQGLSLIMSNKAKLAVESDWFKRTYPECKLKSDKENTQSYYKTTVQGFRRAVSVQSKVTGEGGEVIIIDDPIDSKDAASNTGVAINEVNEWYDNTISRRLRDKKDGIILLIMQRLHANDLTAHLLAKSLESFEHCIIPAIEEDGKTYSYGNFERYREKDELLFPEMEDWDQINIAKEQLGTYGFAGQYQQRPVPKEGGIIKLNWFKRYNVAPEDRTYQVVHSWDTASKATELADFSVGTVWLVTEDRFYLLDMYRGQIEYPELKQVVKNLAAKYPPDTILIEDKSSGMALIQDLNNETTMPILPILPCGDKIVRMSTASPVIEAGNVSLPVVADWLYDFENEISTFPLSKKRDICDSVSQFLNWTKDRVILDGDILGFGGTAVMGRGDW